ncbi:NUDIX domain-containing protein [Lactobacillus sp. ESL0701]|uniref:NUDIX domain-containing protein n=1 Tax=Lactobacillus sp. ESL0701 TaxID=2983217 RepID=UPI0023F70DB6|nr:NUDIX domain-containing protein [Lactobacillus sp. ESL0701]MDF7671937.1 NUDIX domain-containing protein [Lactobacillus sp. ESL0701]
MRARVVIYNCQTQALLLIHRLKDGRDYWVVPGGGAKDQETPVQTAIREVREELQIVLTPKDLHQLFVLQEQEREVFFCAQSVQATTPKISGEEKERSNSANSYLPTWVKFSKLSQLNLMPPQAKLKINEYLKN